MSKRDGVYRKLSADGSNDLVGEAARLTWLRAQGIPVPEVLECQPGLLVTAEVPGRTAAEPWPVEARPRVVEALARLSRALHCLPIHDCPFDRRLEGVVPQALAADPDLDNLDAGRKGWTRQRLVQELLASRPASEDLVVCHGDPCLTNVLLDPDMVEVTGVIDTGRLGVADRWSDLAIATRSLASNQNSQFGPWAATQYLADYGIEVDERKVDFYRLLDEFF